MARTSSEAAFADTREAHIDDTQALCAAALLLARDGALAELGEAETSLVSTTSELHSPGTLYFLKAAICPGGNPLGSAFPRLCSAECRRGQGATNTPTVLVKLMSDWLATYMAHRPPTFVRDVVGTRNLENVHGLHPVEPLSDSALCRLASVLRSRASVTGAAPTLSGSPSSDPRRCSRS